ncbi:MAG: aminotransferase class I/II-fold pyridoxal phosphate-dependent enzyme [Candidatus Mcinerneyibacterium aminivorans]|uniref:Aminotransferase class I/II-fold pyridoxal phosphate-dependent enzyme n=1 Tax=Candidatus Mcinerneyibacterium aminivorans TaxID=2703815 RepID=A0A5D0ML10_9BACT|nr:MAG: aminotransferase class I/II-fold pyridoxal phosphate-dependent enzyme [Candidatus Mcinerneyibacterium aminivorans]
MEDKNLNIETILSHFAENRDKYEGAVVPPIFQSSLFVFKNWDDIDNAFDSRENNFIYSRENNPSVNIIEKKLAKISGGGKAKFFSSGMAAISSAILHCIDKNSHVISVKNIYGPANNFLNKYLKQKMGIEVSFVDGRDITELKNNIKSKTDLIYLESPTSISFSLQNIEKISTIARKNNIKTIIDNTWATPIFQNPFKMGIDLVVHSCSKYINGHSDVVAGAVIGSEEDINSILKTELALFGAKLSPFEAWLILRSLRTLKIRMEKHQENALFVAKFLRDHPAVKHVFYPGLKTHPQYELAKKQLKGFSGLMSFKLKTKNKIEIKKFINNLKIFQLGVSWGGHESLVYVPAISYRKELPEEQFGNFGISYDTIRISVGLENKIDLVHDLEKALNTISF